MRNKFALVLWHVLHTPFGFAQRKIHKLFPLHFTLLTSATAFALTCKQRPYFLSFICFGLDVRVVSVIRFGKAGHLLEVALRQTQVPFLTNLTYPKFGEGWATNLVTRAMGEFHCVPR
jgi:hypothetical protein